MFSRSFLKVAVVAFCVLNLHVVQKSQINLVDEVNNPPASATTSLEGTLTSLNNKVIDSDRTLNQQDDGANNDPKARSSMMPDEDHDSRVGPLVSSDRSASNAIDDISKTDPPTRPSILEDLEDEHDSGLKGNANHHATKIFSHIKTNKSPLDTVDEDAIVHRRPQSSTIDGYDATLKYSVNLVNRRPKIIDREAEHEVQVRGNNPRVLNPNHEQAHASSHNQGLRRTNYQECSSREISKYGVRFIGEVYKTSAQRHLQDANCLNFSCSKDESECDNTSATDYEGPGPPCCVHILRDMAQIFDETMCNLGLDYSAGFGTLLGFVRGGRLIPWTIDNDYIIPSTFVMNAMVELWDAKKTGMAHVFQDINRMCITPDFAGGKLKRWEIRHPGFGTPNADTLWAGGYPYIDLYVGRDLSPAMFAEIPGCRHLKRNIFPTKRVKVYDGAFFQRLPAKPEQLLRTYYGNDWATPRADKSPHGSSLCPFNPPMQ